MEFIPTARFARGCAGAMTLAVSITCASPTSPGRADPPPTSFDSPTLSAAGTVTSVTVTLALPTIAVGDTTIATADVQSTRRRYRGKLRWSSANTLVARVDSIKGVVRGIAVGTALIIATADGVRGQATLTVAADAVPTDTVPPDSIPTDTAPPPPPPPPPPPSARVLFQSDWSTGTGTSQAVLMDQSKALPWNIIGGTGLAVIPSTGLDFPTTNALRVTAMQERTGYAFLRRTGLPIPAVGESRYYRWYSRMAIRDALAVSDRDTHPHQDGNSGSDVNWMLTIYHDNGPGKWLPQLRTQTAENPYPNNRWSGPALDKNVTYRFELQILRTGTSTFQMHVRVYNSAGTLLYTDAHFRSEAGTTLASNPTFVFHNLANLDGFNAGLNGLGGSEWFPSVVYMYQAGLAVCADTWCGPYAR
jgi:hypothetical protein